MRRASSHVILKGTFLGARKSRDAPIDVIQIGILGAYKLKLNLGQNFFLDEGLMEIHRDSLEVSFECIT